MMNASSLKSLPARSVKEIATELFPFACGVVTPGNERLFAALAQYLPFKIHSFPSGSEYNGWVLPDKWSVEKASIKKNGIEIFDGTKHPLGVGALSRSFSGKLSYEELMRHIHSRPELPDAHGYHCMWQYRPWAADWVLCVPHRVVSNWGAGEYEVDLQTSSEPGEMYLADFCLPGESEETIVLNAHTCHPCQANDDIVGMAVGIQLMKWIAEQPRHFTYRLILGPEHLGSVYFLSKLAESERRRLVGGYFLEMPGTPYPLKLASTFLGNTIFDRALKQAAKSEGAAFVEVGWRKGAGNDETVWEAPGYEIPFVEVSRCGEQFAPFREYHSSEDNLENVDWGQVAEFYEVMRATLRILESNCVMTRRFEGLICLSNPKYDLYRERPDPAIKKELPEDAERWGHLLDCLFRYFDGNTTILDIAERHDLNFFAVQEYLSKIAEKELIRFAKKPSDRAQGRRISTL